MDRPEMDRAVAVVRAAVGEAAFAAAWAEGAAMSSEEAVAYALRREEALSGGVASEEA